MTIFICGGILGHLRFGLYDNFHLGRVFWDTSDLDSMTIFIFGGYSGTTGIWTLWQFSLGGSILGHLGFGLYDNFHLGGQYSGTPWFFDSLTIFILGGIWNTSHLDSMTIFIWGGYSGTPQIWTLWQFSFWGVILGHLRFGLPDNFHLGVFWDTLDLDSITTSIGGEYSLTPWIWILWQFSFGGIFRDTLDLDSLRIFIGGEYSGTPQIWTLWQYSFGSILGHLRFGLWQFSFGGSVLGHLGFGLYDNFHFEGGVLWDTLFFWLPENFHFGGIWNTSDLDSMTIFISGGYSGTPWIWTLWQFSFRGILGHLGFGFYDNFHFWAYSGTPWIWTLWQFSFGGSILGHLGFELYDNFHFEGVFWDTSDLDSLTIFIWGFSGTPQIWTVWQFSFSGSI